MKIYTSIVIILTSQISVAWNSEEYEKGHSTKGELDGSVYTGSANHYQYDRSRSEKSPNAKQQICSILEKDATTFALINTGKRKFRLIADNGKHVKILDDFEPIHMMPRLVDVFIAPDDSFFVVYNTPDGYECRKLIKSGGKYKTIMSSMIGIDRAWKIPHDKRMPGIKKDAPLIVSLRASENGFELNFDNDTKKVFTFHEGEADIKCDGQPFWGRAIWYNINVQKDK